MAKVWASNAGTGLKGDSDIEDSTGESSSEGKVMGGLLGSDSNHTEAACFRVWANHENKGPGAV